MAIYEISELVKSLHRIGTSLYGPRYQVYVAEALSEATGRKVTQVQVSRWTLGVRREPNWLPQAVVDMARNGIHELADRQRAVQEEIEIILRGERIIFQEGFQPR
jgi:hypothetical protein